MPTDEIYAKYLAGIQAELQHALTSHHPRFGPYYGMMQYHLGWVDEKLEPTGLVCGKHVRSLLCLLTCEAVGGNPEHALPAAVAVELVHNSSLIHDDIQDGSPCRRNRQSVWSMWGVPHAINVGDGLMALAHLALHNLLGRGVPMAAVTLAFRILDEAYLALCHGQYLDMALEGHVDALEDTYLEMIGGKTAALLAASTQIGALIGRSSPLAGTPPRADEDRGGARDTLQSYQQFGWHLGLAFQMVDDLLGIWGDPAVTGKSAADDLRTRKMTLPVIFALRNSRKGEQLATIYGREALGDQDLGQAVAILDEAGAQQYVQRLAAQHAASAMAALDAAAPRSPAAAHLRELSASLTGRRK